MMPSQPLAQPAYSSYPGGYPRPPFPPRPRRRTGLIVGVVISIVVFVGAVTGLAVFNASTAGSGDDRDSGAGEDTTASSSARPAMALPAGCELLPRARAVPHVPGELEEPMGEGPAEWAEGQTRSSCDWTTDPGYAGRNGIPSASLLARAIAAVSEDVARQAMEIHYGPCDESDPAYHVVEVPGAEEACLIHTAHTSGGEFVESASVIARHGTLVVETQYNHGDAPLRQIDRVATTVTAGVIATVMRAG